MGKKKTTWLSPKKQAELDEKNRLEKKKKTIKIAIISVLVAAILAGIVIGLVIWLQPLDPIYAYIEIENYGTIALELDPNTAPITVENFVKLAEEGFYDGLTFHRIIKDFMMQGGCPKGNGTGDSGTDIVGEFSANGYDNDIAHSRGVISMARGNEYNSGSSQFFIVHKDSPHLDGNYAAFGHVISGMDIVDKICTEAKPTDSNGTIKKEEQPKIITIRIERVSD